MAIKKISLIGILVLLLISLAGCNKEIPEGEIKDYVLNFNYDNSYKETKVAESIMVSP